MEKLKDPLIRVSKVQENDVQFWATVKTGTLAEYVTDLSPLTWLVLFADLV